MLPRCAAPVQGSHYGTVLSLDVSRHVQSWGLAYQLRVPMQPVGSLEFGVAAAQPGDN
jgi:hypothetical protein